jgi:hypothetical protein
VTKALPKAGLVAQHRDAEPRSSGTKISFLCVRVFGLSLCGFHPGQSHANHNGQMKCFFISVFPRLYGNFKLHVVLSRWRVATRAHGCGNLNRLIPISRCDTGPRLTDTFVRGNLLEKSKSCSKIWAGNAQPRSQLGKENPYNRGICMRKAIVTSNAEIARARIRGRSQLCSCRCYAALGWVVPTQRQCTSATNLSEHSRDNADTSANAQQECL